MSSARLIIQDLKEGDFNFSDENVPSNVDRLIIFSECIKGKSKVIAKAYSMKDRSIGICENGLRKSKFKLSILKYIKKVLSESKQKFISVCVADEKLANKLSKFLGGKRVGLRIKATLNINPLYNVYIW